MAAAKSWDKRIAPGVLREENDERMRFAAPDADGQAMFSENAVLYASNKRTAARPIVPEPTPG